jgi:single-strand DNA-binding protein
MPSLNKVTLIGHIGRDAETKFTPSGVDVTSFSLATSFKPKDGQEQTEWHNIEAWRKEKIAGYLTKGKLIYIEGRIKTESWEKDGEKKYRTKIVAEQIIFLSKNNESAARSEENDSAPLTDDDVPF